MTVVALNLSTGIERWRFDAAHGHTEAEMVGECAAQAAICGDREFHRAQLAISGNAVYLFAPIPAEVVSLAATNGVRHWIVSMAERTGLFSRDASLLATDDGVVVGAFNPRAMNPAQMAEYLGYWSAQDGSEIWTEPIWPGDPGGNPTPARPGRGGRIYVCRLLHRNRDRPEHG